jgi:hypothetical protein
LTSREAPPPKAAATRWFAVKNCPPLIASVLFVARVPDATLTILRSSPTEPTETVLATSATEPKPIATEFEALACAPWPNAEAFAALASAPLPTAVALSSPAAVAPARAPCPTAVVLAFEYALLGVWPSMPPLAPGRPLKGSPPAKA